LLFGIIYFLCGVALSCTEFCTSWVGIFAYLVPWEEQKYRGLHLRMRMFIVKILSFGTRTRGNSKRSSCFVGCILHDNVSTNANVPNTSMCQHSHLARSLVQAIEEGVPSTDVPALSSGLTQDPNSSWFGVFFANI